MNSSSPEISDERLSAYLDATLEAPDADALERALERDPRSARCLARMIRNDRRLRQHFHAAARRPVPESISALLEPSPRPGRSWWTALAGRLPQWSGAPVPWRVAGAVALVAVVGLGLLVVLDQGEWSNASRKGPALVQVLPSTSADISDFLDRQPSGRAVTLKDDLRGVVDMSFKHVDGRHCRQYRVALGDRQPAFAAIACRSGNDWQEVLMQRLDTPIAESGMFHAASGQASSLLDGYILEHKSGDIMVGDPEAQLIESGWSKP
ncbi:MAG TPA: DVU3141 family protein [Wenzhouxiangella sp.]|nr:DVU3141 family protein [Wenzhouxiangella sp.]